jgi:hypothetical protein
MADSSVVVKALTEVDPGFVSLCSTLFGPEADATEIWSYLYTQEGLSKMMPAPSDISTPSVPGTAGKAIRTGRRVAKIKAPAAQILTNAATTVNDNGAALTNKIIKTDRKKVSKGTQVTWNVEFTKSDEDKRQVFGWAAVVEIDGHPVVDRQGDLIDPEEIEKAAYSYMLKSRKGGNQHRRDGDDPLHVSDVIESFVVTPEKISKMGLPTDTPCGWWVGYQITDDDTWSEVKAGRKTGFSIHGAGKRRDV